MRSTLTLCAALMVLVVGAGSAQQIARLSEVPVVGLPADARIVRYSVQEIGSQSQLVLETTSSDGVVALYALDLVDGVLIGRLIGQANVPTRFEDVELVFPLVREFAGHVEVDTYWPVGGLPPLTNNQFVSLVPLQDLRFAPVENPQGPEMPSASSPLAVRYVVANPDGTVHSSCVLEPNLVTASQRLTTTGATWVRIHGLDYLLVEFLIDGDFGGKEGFLRLYTESFAVAFESHVLRRVDPNRIVPPVFVDLTGDGSEEVVLFTDGEQRPLLVLQSEPGAGTGIRTIGYNSCGTRMNGTDVLQLQRALVEAGYPVGRFGEDGWYGPDTRGAVIAFQKDNDLPATGVANELTWRLLLAGE